MQLNLSQHMKLSQQMKLAPRMIQSMEILQLPVMALAERIDQELADNPVLEAELVEPEVSETEAEVEFERAREEADASAVDRKELVVDTEHNNEADFERLLEMAELWPEDNVTSASKPSANRIEDESGRQHDVMANMVARPQSLQEYLLEQFAFFNMPPEIREFGEYLIQNLDGNGRLQGTLPEIVQVFNHDYGRSLSMDQATEALRLIQKLDPPGVGARDYKECLLLQVRPGMPYSDVLKVLICDHLEDIHRNRLPQIQRKTGYSLETIKQAIHELTQLNPWPGRDFEVAEVEKVTPDLVVELDEQGHYVVRLLDEYTPTLRISPYYIKQFRNTSDPATKAFIRKKIESAKWLIESIEQRHSTLRRVAQAIVDAQTDFLNNGPEYIVPLKMQQIADKVGVHVTTVSRAVDDKWIQTPRGLFPLKRFFGGGTTTAEGEEVAWDIIRLKLKEIVDREDKNAPLSDDDLVAELAKAGYNLARRTVTKYRKALRIPSSRQRRQF